MEVIPAVDIRGGKCVRFFQGDYDRETVFADDPVDAAVRWAGLGARWLHVVDLDGAKLGEPVNLDIVERIASSTNASVQVGGGVRSIETARRLLSVGADRVLIGTAAIENPEVAREVCERFGPESVIVSVDARDGYVALKGWTETSAVRAIDLVGDLMAVGVLRFMYTDIARDGTLTEPNFSAVQALVPQAPSLLAAGGISSLGHLKRLASLGVEGAIVGTAVYTGSIDLREAVQHFRKDR